MPPDDSIACHLIDVKSETVAHGGRKIRGVGDGLPAGEKVPGLSHPVGSGVLVEVDLQRVEIGCKFLARLGCHPGIFHLLGSHRDVMEMVRHVGDGVRHVAKGDGGRGDGSGTDAGGVMRVPGEAGNVG